MSPFNIAFGVKQHDSRAVTQAARLADVHGNIKEFQQGCNAILGERGVTVSGGQKPPEAAYLHRPGGGLTNRLHVGIMQHGQGTGIQKAAVCRFDNKTKK